MKLNVHIHILIFTFLIKIYVVLTLLLSHLSAVTFIPREKDIGYEYSALN
jgi:hypothetical protein